MSKKKKKRGKIERKVMFTEYVKKNCEEECMYDT